MSGTKNAGRPFHVGDDDNGLVTVQKVFTGMGERLQLTAEAFSRTNRLDAMVLESVTWQDPDELREWAVDIDRSDTALTETAADSEECDDTITVSNEFAYAEVTKEVDGDSEYLRVSAPKLGYDIRLGPQELEWLAVQDHERFTEWFEHPFGPETDEHH
jgi:hypothetical protein